MNKSMWLSLRIFLISLCVIGIDQLSKYFIVTSRILPVYYNRTIAFSLPVVWYLPWLAIGAVILYAGTQYRWDFSRMNLYLSRYPLLILAIPFIIGGGVSNVFDRVLNHGAVIDFIDLRFWPIFNLADSAIVIGVLLIIYSLYIADRRKYGKQQNFTR